MNYHFILTTEAGGIHRSNAGTVPVNPGATRSDVLKLLRDQLGSGPGVVILFFSLEPDDLGVTSRIAFPADPGETGQPS
jgi:hypothetical protein